MVFGKFLTIIKAILTRVIFASHGLIAIWRATTIKHDPYYWYLTASILALSFEGVFTLTIKKSQEWKWFCPSVFFYLCSVVPAIWIIEVDKFDSRLARMEGLNITGDGQNDIQNLFEGIVQIPQFDSETWATVIEQLLMLILIIGRWMLPKGGLTRDQLSQLLLVYIGTAADIIEFFDTFKEPKIAAERLLCLMILAIWSWSLLQFTFVLTATKARRTRLTGETTAAPKAKLINGIVKVKQVCCTIDVWAILINIILQDAPFLIFRLLLITYFKIITYMNVFFTCKNTLVIILQFYRLFVVQVERRKETSKAIAKVKASIGSNLARTIERSAFIPTAAMPSGPTKQQQKKQGIKVGGAGGGGNSSAVNSKENIFISRHKALVNSSKGRKGGSKSKLQDSVSFLLQDTKRQRANDGSKNLFRGRRKSLSTGNLRDLVASNPSEDDELIAESILSGTNETVDDNFDDAVETYSEEEDDDVDEEEGERDKEQQHYIIVNENENRHPRLIKLRDGVYKISGGSKSSESSMKSLQQGGGTVDVGYSSSSKESGHSSRINRRNYRDSRNNKPKPSNSNQNNKRIQQPNPLEIDSNKKRVVNVPSKGKGKRRPRGETTSATENERI